MQENVDEQTSIRRMRSFGKLLFLGLFILAGCNQIDDNMDSFYKMYGDESADVSRLIEKVSQRPVYLGHQSVGSNILGGIAQWETESGVEWPKKESREWPASDSMSKVSLVHFGIGQNGGPHSKIDDFASLVDGIPQEGKPVVFFKFCFVDVDAGTDVEALFSHYQEQMLNLKEKYPHLQFVLITVPLTYKYTGLKEMARKLLGRSFSRVKDNASRDLFNTLLREKLADHFPVFDLARLESTTPDGQTYGNRKKGKEIPRMYPAYSADGGHLNEFGAKYISWNLLAFLAELE